jgi:RNA polymerase sigma-70 factor (ECF subfamily)
MSQTDADSIDIQAMAGGDRGALARLYDRHAPTLLALGLSMLRNRPEAEDLLHDVFLEAWRQAAAYDPQRGSVRTWLLVRMRSRALDRRRSAVRCSTLRADAEPIVPESAAPEPWLRDALASLPSEQRTVLELAYFEGLSATSIASRTGVPTGTVKSRLAAGLGKLRSALRDRGSQRRGASASRDVVL